MVGIPAPPIATSSYCTGSGTAGALVQSATGVQVLAEAGIDAYIRFYNNERPHQALRYRTPAQVYHQALHQLSDTAAADSLNRALSLSN